MMDKYFQWERMTLADLIVVMIKYMNFDRVEMSVISRPEVASRVWFRLEIKSDDGPHTGFVEGQSIDIVHRRLIEFLDERKYREAYKNTLP